jgi:hypothetical protein
MNRKRCLLIVFFCAVLILAACTPRSTPAPAALPPTPVPPTATLPPTPTVDAALACLQGDWSLAPATATSLLAAITGVPSLQIQEGALLLKFEGDTFAYHSSDLSLRSAFLDGFLDADANVLIEGTFAIVGDQLSFTKTGAKNELYNWRAVSGDDVQPFYGITPVVNFDIPPSAGFACNGDVLLLQVADFSGASLALDFTRVK